MEHRTQAEEDAGEDAQGSVGFAAYEAWREVVLWLPDG